MLLGVYYSSLSVVLWLRYTLNKLDTSSNGIYTVRNPRAGYVTTSLRSVVTTTVLGFLNRVDPLDSVSTCNYYLVLHCTCSCISSQVLFMPYNEGISLYESYQVHSAITMFGFHCFMDINLLCGLDKLLTCMWDILQSRVCCVVHGISRDP